MLVFLVLLPPAACVATSPPREVHALRFRQMIVESAVDFVHGGGAWHDVLYLPDLGVVAQVVWEEDVEMTDRPRPKRADGANVRSIPRMHAWYGALDDELTTLVQEDGRTPELEHVQIPASLAAAIVDLADRTTRQRELARHVGRAAVEARAVGGEDTVRPRDR